MAGIDLSSLEECLNKHIPADELKVVKRLLFGRSEDKELKLEAKTLELAEKYDFEVKGYSFTAKPEDLRKPRIVRIAAVQCSIVKPTTDPIHVQREAIHEKVTKIIAAAAASNANIVCMHEVWAMPFFFGTREKHPWTQFAEDAENGPTTKLMRCLAKQYNMVIVSSILERDEEHGDILWNTGVVISNTGNYLGKSRKVHIPRFGAFNESTYYAEGNSGHPVFDTEFGKIAVNICFGRHHPQNWMMLGLNGAEIVFNPSAVIDDLSEPLWFIEARNAAVANSYFTVALNRVGTEIYDSEFTIGNGTPARHDFGPFFGSSYVAAPNGERCPGLSRNRDGVLITEVDLNLCRQMKDHWSFRMTQRLPMYVESLTAAAKLDYKPQIVRENQ